MESLEREISYLIHGKALPQCHSLIALTWIDIYTKQLTTIGSALWAPV